MGCAACGSGKVKRRDNRARTQRERLDQALTTILRTYEKRETYFLADRTGEWFSLAAAVATVRECEQIEVAMGLKRGTHSLALWAGLLDKPEIAALIEDVKNVKLTDGNIFVVTEFKAGGLVHADNIVEMSLADAATKALRAP